MRALVLSDIHANLEALEAVLAAAEGQWDELWNLGDIVGYGGSPNEVIERIQPLQSLVVRGNHDRVSCGLSSSNGFNPVARAAILWTRKALTPENLEWLKQVPQGPIQPACAGVTCAHGSPLDEDQYIINMRDAWAPLQQMQTPVTFFGHTHLQGGFSQKDHDWHELRPQFHGPRDEPAEWVFDLPPNTRQLINPGSVGQPRDHDWRAGFALFNSNDPEARRITYHRVPYDLAASQAKIVAAGLPERLAARLREGR